MPDGDSPVKSLYLLKGAFSHFAFADALPMDRSRGGALKGMAARVDGPLVASFSVHDTAVGKLYPLASMSSRDDAAGLEDRLYRWGGIGHDGAQAVDATVAAQARSGPATRSSGAASSTSTATPSSTATGRRPAPTPTSSTRSWSGPGWPPPVWSRPPEPGVPTHSF